MDEEQTNEEEEANELYRDVNVNLEGRDTEMTDSPQTNIQSTRVTEDTHVIITAATPEGQQQSSSVSSGFILNMLNPNPNIVKEQVKEQVSKILPKIEKFVNEQLEAEVLTRSSYQAKTSHAKTLYKALVDAYETEKDILETYGDTVTFKRLRDDQDKDEEPSAGSNRGSKRRLAGKEPESTSAPKEKTSKSTDKSKEGSKSHHTSTGKSAQEEPIHDDEDLDEPAHQEFDTGFTEDQSVNETTQHPDWFQKPTKPPTPDHDWNKTLPAKHGPVQPWIST
ncbi:hypothetical protein Tco_1426203 [Tanacetum coccineum]